MENEGNGSFLIVVKEEEATSTSGEKGGILVPKIKSAVVLAGTIGCKTEVLDISGCVTESVKCKYLRVGKITFVGPTEVGNTLE